MIEVTALRTFLDEYQEEQEQAQVLIVGSETWAESINPALFDYGKLSPSHEEALILRMIIERIYYLGYQRGRREAQAPKFTEAAG